MDLGYGFNAYTADGDIISGIFSDNDFKMTLDSILERGIRGHILQIYFQKKRIYLRSRFSNITPEELKTFINSLAVLAEIIENK